MAAQAQAAPPPMIDKAIAQSLHAIVRCGAAALLEANICQTANDGSPYFVRGIEHATSDFGILTSETVVREMPQDATDRYFTLFRGYRTSSRNLVIPGDIKSMVYLAHSEQKTNRVGRKYMKAVLKLTRDQAKDIQVLFLCCLTEPDWMAIVPMSYVRDRLYQFGGGYGLYLGTMPTTMYQLNPFPPSLAPFIMPTDMIGEAIENMVANARDSSVKLRNPFSGLDYEKPTSLSVQPFRLLTNLGDREAMLRFRIWTAFQNVANTQVPPEFLMRNPIIAPYTSDMRLDHINGTSVFIEIKTKHARVETLQSGRQNFFHEHRALGKGIPIFTFRAPWDYFLTMTNDDEGYLLKKEDIPVEFWHKDIDNREPLVHQFPDDVFLRRRRILLTWTSHDIVRAFRRVICGSATNPHAQPGRTQMTAEDIYRVAGPCPREWLNAKYVARSDEEVEVAPAFTDNDDAEDTVVDREDGDDPDEETAAAAPWRGTKFITRAAQARYRVQGGVSDIQDAQLIIPLMERCRKSGTGCVLDLGKWHTYARIGFIRHLWTEEEKVQFDQTGKPPCWIGMLHSQTPMLTVNAMTSKWPRSYAPIEGTRMDVQGYLDASPCLVAITGLSIEGGHDTVQRWLVPTEFMPKIHIGNIKQSNKPGMCRTELFLENKISIGRLVTREERLHETLLGFFTTNPTTAVGIGKVPVNPAPYLRQVGEYKRLAESEFDRILSTGARSDRSSMAVGDEDEDEEMEGA